MPTSNDFVILAINGEPPTILDRNDIESPEQTDLDRVHTSTRAYFNAAGRVVAGSLLRDRELTREDELQILEVIGAKFGKPATRADRDPTS